MAAKKDATKTAKLAAALKDNLKRRKAQAKARGVAAKGLGTAPQAGLEDQPQKGPNVAPKRPRT
jgi:hypothetical protein